MTNSRCSSGAFRLALAVAAVSTVAGIAVMASGCLFPPRFRDKSDVVSAVLRQSFPASSWDINVTPGKIVAPVGETEIGWTQDYDCTISSRQVASFSLFFDTFSAHDEQDDELESRVRGSLDYGLSDFVGLAPRAQESLAQTYVSALATQPLTFIERITKFGRTEEAGRDILRQYRRELDSLYYVMPRSVYGGRAGTQNRSNAAVLHYDRRAKTWRVLRGIGQEGAGP